VLALRKQDETAMATADLERMLDDCAMAWSSNDPELIHALVTDDRVFSGRGTKGKL